MAQAEYFCSPYKQYKLDTNYVTTWLVQSARQAGYVLPRDEKTSVKITNSKKQRRKAEKAASTQPTGTNKVIIKTRQLLDLARYIANTTLPSSSVSRLLINTLKRAIQFRKDSNRYFKTAHLEDTKGHDSHAHMIEVLQDILNILGARPSPQDTSSDSPSTFSLSNLFENLEVEVSSEGSAHFVNYTALEKKIDSSPPPLKTG